MNIQVKICWFKSQYFTKAAIQKCILVAFTGFILEHFLLLFSLRWSAHNGKMEQSRRDVRGQIYDTLGQKETNNNKENSLLFSCAFYFFDTIFENNKTKNPGRFQICRFPIEELWQERESNAPNVYLYTLETKILPTDTTAGSFLLSVVLKNTVWKWNMGFVSVLKNGFV